MTLMFVNRHAKTCTKVCALSASMMNECRQACLGASTDLIIVLAVNIASFRRLARLVCLLVRNEQTLDNARRETDKHEHTKYVAVFVCCVAAVHALQARIPGAVLRGKISNRRGPCQSC